MSEPGRGEPIDPDVDLHVAAQRRELRRGHSLVLPVIAAGGGLGSLARYAVSRLMPTDAAGFPWATFWTNVAGCLLIGGLMVLIVEVWTAHPLVRPFLGVGVLGGFTTFSAYAVEALERIDGSAPEIGLAYLVGTVAAALVAVEIGIQVTRRFVRTRAGRRR